MAIPDQSFVPPEQVVAVARKRIEDWMRKTALLYRNRGLPPCCYISPSDAPQRFLSNPTDSRQRRESLNSSERCDARTNRFEDQPTSSTDVVLIPVQCPSCFPNQQSIPPTCKLDPPSPAQRRIRAAKNSNARNRKFSGQLKPTNMTQELEALPPLPLGQRNPDKLANLGALFPLRMGKDSRRPSCC